MCPVRKRKAEYDCAGAAVPGLRSANRRRGKLLDGQLRTEAGWIRPIGYQAGDLSLPLTELHAFSPLSVGLLFGLRVSTICV